MGYYRFIGLFIPPSERSKIEQFLEYTYGISQRRHFKCTHVALDTSHPDYNDIIHAETGIPAVCYATHYLNDDYMDVLKIEVPFPHKKKQLHLTSSIADNPRNPGYPTVKSCRGNALVESFEISQRTTDEELLQNHGWGTTKHALQFEEPLEIRGTIDAFRYRTYYKH